MPSTPSGAVPACPERSPALSRRAVLLGAAGLAALSVGAAGCGAPPPEPDELEGQLELARRDSEMANAAAAVAGPFYAPVLTVVADERADHAKALAEELARAANAPLATTAVAGATSTTPAPPAPPPTREQVTAAVRESAESAAQLAARLSGYRAGLVGSIAASCAASVAVPLAMKAPAR